MDRTAAPFCITRGNEMNTRFDSQCSGQSRSGAALDNTAPSPKLRACAILGALFCSVLAANAQAQQTVQAGAPLHVTIGVAAAAAAAQAQTEHGPNCVGDLAMHTSVNVPLGKSTMVSLPEPVRSRTVGNPSVVQALLVSPRTLYLLGADIGTTNMIVQGRSGACSVIDVAVTADPGGLQHAINQLIPDEKDVHVSAAADTLVLSGTVSDGVKVQRILELADAFAQRPSRALPPPGTVANPMQAVQPATPATTDQNVPHPRIVNMLSVAAPQQVMLEVKVAEVSKTLINELGSAANINAGSGSWSFNLLTDFLTGGMSALIGRKANNKPLNFAIDAEKDDQLVKVLAEPNLLAISGQEASFLAGGKVFIPVPQSNTGSGTTVVLQEEDFGVGLRFTPTVLEGGRINLKVAPEVSELSPTGVALTTSNSNLNTVLPLITTRRASTTVQLYDGQSFAIGGLLKNNISGAIKALPGVGELPILGALARSTNYQNDRTELVFVVTPHLAKPLPKTYPLPTDHFGQVSEFGVLATGNMEGKAPAKAPAPTPAPTAPQPVSALPAPAGKAQPDAGKASVTTVPQAAATQPAETQPATTQAVATPSIAAEPLAAAAPAAPAAPEPSAAPAVTDAPPAQPAAASPDASTSASATSSAAPASPAGQSADSAAAAPVDPNATAPGQPGTPATDSRATDGTPTAAAPRASTTLASVALHKQR